MVANKFSVLAIMLLSTFMVYTASAGTLTATPNPPSVSNAVIDVGQVANIITVISGGNSPYSVTWEAFQPNVSTTTPPGGACSSGSGSAFLLVQPISSTAVNLIDTCNQLPNPVTTTAIAGKTIYGSWPYNAYVIDSGGFNSVTTGDISLTINPAFNYGNSNPSGSYDEGQTVSMTAYASGGTPSYTYNFPLRRNGDWCQSGSRPMKTCCLLQR